MTDDNYEPKHAAPAATPLLTNEAYDFLKHAAQYWLPALGTFYFAIAAIWHLPAAEEVVGTIVALDALIGVLLGYSKKSYKASGAKFDGLLLVDQRDPETDRYSFEVDDLDKINEKNELTLKVVKPTE